MNTIADITSPTAERHTLLPGEHVIIELRGEAGSWGGTVSHVDSSAVRIRAAWRGWGPPLGRRRPRHEEQVIPWSHVGSIALVAIDDLAATA